MTDLFQKIAAAFILLIAIAIAVTLFFLFTYIFVILFVIAVIIGGIAYLYARFIQPKKTSSVDIHHKGRIIEQEEDHKE